MCVEREGLISGSWHSLRLHNLSPMFTCRTGDIHPAHHGGKAPSRQWAGIMVSEAGRAQGASASSIQCGPQSMWAWGTAAGDYLLLLQLLEFLSLRGEVSRVTREVNLWLKRVAGEDDRGKDIKSHNVPSPDRHCLEEPMKKLQITTGSMRKTGRKLNKIVWFGPKLPRFS